MLWKRDGSAVRQSFQTLINLMTARLNKLSLQMFGVDGCDGSCRRVLRHGCLPWEGAGVSAVTLAPVVACPPVEKIENWRK